jgi:hypothetical protein
MKDICRIYIRYCGGALKDVEFEKFDFSKNEIKPSITGIINKNVFSKFDKTRLYLLSQIHSGIKMEIKYSDDFDQYVESFMKVLFGEKQIIDFNLSLFLKELYKKQDEEFHNVLSIRWEAIQDYFNDDLENCFEKMKTALDLAKQLRLPEWFIQDILIDLRNLDFLNANKNNTVKLTFKYQKEIEQKEKELYSPIIDRFDKSLSEEMIKNEIKDLIKPALSVNIRNELNTYLNHLVKIFITSILYPTFPKTITMEMEHPKPERDSLVFW